MGAWNYVEEQMQSIIDKRELRYVGRALAASPAAGAHKVHHDQQEAIGEQAFSANPRRSANRTALGQEETLASIASHAVLRPSSAARF